MQTPLQNERQLTIRHIAGDGFVASVRKRNRDGLLQTRFYRPTQASIRRIHRMLSEAPDEYKRVNLTMSFIGHYDGVLAGLYVPEKGDAP